MLAIFISWFTKAIMYGTAILYGAMGETLTEKSGCMNLGTPGIMAIGGACGFISGYLYEVNTADPSAVGCALLVMACSFLGGVLAALLFSVLTITLRANQNVTGLALTIFGVGIAKFFGLYIIPAGSVSIKAVYANTVFTKKIPALYNIPVIGEMFFSYGFMTYLAIVLAVIMAVVMNRTRVGLSLRAIGENAATADAAGLNVLGYRYAATLLGGGLCGLGGLYYIMEVAYSNWSTASVDAMEAVGWLAVALVIFSNWRSDRAIWGSYLFGLCYWAFNYVPGLIGIQISSQLFQMLPYIVTIIVLIIGSLRKSRETQPPGALGRPYFREDR